MPTLLPGRYAVDLTGDSANNAVSGEPHTLVRKKIRCIAPTHAPFFKKNIEVFDAVTSVKLNATQYSCLNIVPLPSAIAGVGNEVYAIIAITDESVSDDVILNYQTVGGEYVQSFSSTLNLIESLTADNRPAAWPNIMTPADTFVPSLHLHAVGDMIGFEYLVVALDQVRTAILLGDAKGHESILKYIDQQTLDLTSLIASASSTNSLLNLHLLNKANPHAVTKAQVGLGLVQNYPVASTAEATAGTATNRYMTPALVSSAIASTQSSGLGSHPTNVSNPHSVTKAQVGLGSVSDYPVASTTEATAGTATDRYMTPALVKQSVNDAAANAGSATTNHIANISNPHTVTKEQVGLGLVQNYPVANNTEATAGTATDRYMTPSNVKAAITSAEATQGSGLNAHIADVANPHAVTKAQVGLGLVENYPVANSTEATAGTATDRYVTPALVKQVISASETTQANTLSLHSARIDNPHAVTKAQVGLGDLQNYPTASDAEATAGIATDRYVTPLGARLAISGLLSDKISVFEKGAVDGVAPLDASMKIPVIHLGNVVKIPGPPTYDIQNFINGKPLVNEVLIRTVSVRAFTCSANFAGSLAYCTNSAAADFIIEILKNGINIGSLTYAVGSNTGVFTSASQVTFNVGDQLAMRCLPTTQDATLSDLSITLFGTSV